MNESTATPTFEPLLDSEAASKLLGGCHVKTLQRNARSGNIPGHFVLGRWYFRASELDAWLRSEAAAKLARLN
jgi:hypothetical protein